MKKYFVLVILVILFCCKKEAPPTPDAGNVTFWYNSNGTNATVTIGGQTGYITKYYSTFTPTCGTDGCANFSLYVGTYSFHATSTFSTWNGNVTVTKNGCTLYLLQ